MSTEPNWPTMDSNRNSERWFSTPADQTDFEAIDFIYACAVEDCRVAWLFANEDPSVDRMGTVRQDPKNSAWLAVRQGESPAGATDEPWMLMSLPGYANGVEHDHVKGWPVIGAVPGTPAAEAQQ